MLLLMLGHKNQRLQAMLEENIYEIVFLILVFYVIQLYLVKMNDNLRVHKGLSIYDVMSMKMKRIICYAASQSPDVSQIEHL